MKNFFIACSLLISCSIFAQKAESPYTWDWNTDGIWTGAGLVGSAGGLLLIQNKDDLTIEDLNNLSIDDINGIDRWAAGNNSKNAGKLSDIGMATSFAAPFTLLLDDKINDNTGQILLLYIEALSTTATLYTITAGLVDKSRPYVYDESGITPLDRRLNANGQRSFYAGHVAASATATFFAAKVYNDFYPNSSTKYWIWTGAAIIPASVAAFRVEAGQHFLTDVIIGYVLGAAAGILIPELHKKKERKFDVSPASGVSLTGDNYTALSLRYTF